MMRNDLTQKILFDPLQDEADELYILAAYATPNMLSWFGIWLNMSKAAKKKSRRPKCFILRYWLPLIHTECRQMF